MAESWLDQALKKIERMPQEALDMREMALKDLYFFATLVNPGYVYGDVHREFFQWMQDYQLYGEGDDLTGNKLIMLPRAHLKSHMVATWTAWIITRHPEVSVLYLSATSELAERQLFAIQGILTSPVYMRYFPEYVNPQEGKREKWTTSYISIDHPKRREEAVRDATISTAGLTTNTTGWHADIIVADDLVVPENAYTETGREAVAKKASQFTSIRNPGGFTMACGTRYHPNDVYATWKSQDYEIYDEDGQVVGKNLVWEIREYAVETDGQFLWPRTMRASDKKFFGYDNRVLARIRGEYIDRTQFYAQYYNDPNDISSNRIGRECFQYYNKKHLTNDMGRWYFKDEKLNVYAAIDFAYTVGKKSDYSAIVVIGIDSRNNVYVLDIDMFKTDKISDYFQRVIHMNAKWEFRKLRAEVTAAQSIIVRDLKDRLKEEGRTISIEEFRPTRNEGSKEERIAAALEHRYENLLMWHTKGGFTDVLEEQLVQARPQHDDLKDALASAVEIAVKPKRSQYDEDRNRNNIKIFNSRFGGVSFRG